MWRFLNLVLGSYVYRLGNTLGDVQHLSKDGFFAFVTEQARIVEVSSPIPWTIVFVRSDF